MAYELNYELINNDTEYEVSGYTGEPVELVIPSEYSGKPVTSISWDAFNGCSSLTSAVIGDNVTEIGDNAFYYCSKLTSVLIGDGVTSIGECAFGDCNSLTSIVIPNSVTSIGSNAFCGCSGLTSVVIGDGVTSIGEEAFSYCNSLTSVAMPDIEFVNEHLFSGCFNLREVTFLRSTKVPRLVYAIEWEGMKDFEVGPFDDAHTDLQILVPDFLYTKWKARWGDYSDKIVAVSVSTEEELKYNLLANDTYEVTGIGTFAGSELIIPDTYNGKAVTKIGHTAFAECENLTRVVIPDSITSMGDYAFGYCRSLTSITLIAKTPPTIQFGTFYKIPASAQFYCYFNALQKYHTATNWKSYADKFVADDLRLYFTMGAGAQKKYFASKNNLEKVETRFEGLIDTEIATRTTNDNKILNALTQELTDRTTADNEIIQTIEPMTDEEIDDLWDTPAGDTTVDPPSAGGLPSFALTNGFVPVWNGLTFEDGIELDKIGKDVVDILVDQEYDQTSTNPQSGTAVAEAIKNLSNKLDEKLMTCRYFSVPAGKYYPLKRNGTYMIYNSKDDSGKEHTISLVRRDDGTWATVCTGVKQLSLSTPVVAINGRYTYQLCGIAHTGDSLVGIPQTDGFRQATTNYAYVTSTGTMYVCESVQGKPLSIQDTQAKCIGPKGEAYKG